LTSLRPLYERIRPTIKDGGEIVVYVFNKSDAQLKADDLAFWDGALPDRDRSTINFFGSPRTALLRRSYLRVSISFQQTPSVVPTGRGRARIAALAAAQIALRALSGDIWRG